MSMEKYSYEQAENEAVKIRETALQEKEQRNEEGEPLSSDYIKGEATLRQEKLESTHKMITTLWLGSNLNNANYYAKQCDNSDTIVSQITRFNVLIQMERLHGAAQLVIDSYEHKKTVSSGRIGNRIKFIGERELADIIGHEIPYAICDDDGKIKEVCDVFETSRKYQGNESAEEIYEFCKSIKNALKQIDIQNDSLIEFLDICDKVELDRSKGMTRLIQNVLKNKTSQLKPGLFNQKETLNEQDYAEIDKTLEKFTNNKYVSFNEFINAAKEYNVVLDEAKNKIPPCKNDEIIEFQLRKTLYRSDIDQLCVIKENAL